MLNHVELIQFLTILAVCVYYIKNMVIVNKICQKIYENAICVKFYYRQDTPHPIDRNPLTYPRGRGV